MEYQLLTEETAELLGEEVTTALTHGWELYGSPFYADGQYRFCQALTRSDSRELTLEYVTKATEKVKEDE
jgi:hypothetical protein